MKPKALFFLVLLLSGVLSAFISLTPEAEALESSVTLLDDTRCYMDAPDTNYGDLDRYDGKNATPANKQIIAYLKFDLSEFAERLISEATLYAYAYEQPSGGWGEIGARRVTNQTWLEDQITWNDKPDTGIEEDTFDPLAVGWCDWNVTDFVIDQQGNDNVSFCLYSKEEFSSWRGATFASKEDLTDPEAQLNITYEIPPNYRNAGQEHNTISQGESNELSAEGYHETGLDWAWIATNETGSWQNFTDYEDTIDNGHFQMNTPQSASYYSGTYDRTYIVWLNKTSSTMDVVVNHYDHDSKSFGTPHIIDDTITEKDDHVGGSLIVLPDGKIRAFWIKGHTDQLRSRVTSNPEDISAWESIQTLNSSVLNAYPNCVKNSTDHLHLFRIYSILSTHAAIIQSVSSDNGSTWSDRNIIDFGNNICPYYFAWYDASNNSIHLTVFLRYYNASNLRKNIYYMRSLDGGASWQKMDGTSITLPANASTLDHVTDAHNVRVHDIKTGADDKPRILFSQPINATEPTVWMASYSGSWSNESITTTCAFYASGQINAYLCAGSIDPNNENITYIGHKVGDYGEMQEWTKSGSWSNTKNITYGSSYHNALPRIPLNYHSELKLLWHYGSYTGFGQFDTDIKIYPHVSSYYDSPIDLRNVADTWTWTNFTWNNASMSSGLVGWRIYYNSTVGTTNKTGILAFNIASEYEEEFISTLAINGDYAKWRTSFETYDLTLSLFSESSSGKERRFYTSELVTVSEGHSILSETASFFSEGLGFADGFANLREGYAAFSETLQIAYSGAMWLERLASLSETLTVNGQGIFTKEMFLVEGEMFRFEAVKPLDQLLTWSEYIMISMEYIEGIRLTDGLVLSYTEALTLDIVLAIAILAFIFALTAISLAMIKSAKRR